MLSICTHQWCADIFQYRTSSCLVARCGACLTTPTWLPFRPSQGMTSTTVGLEHDHGATMPAIDTSSGIHHPGRPYDGSHSYNNLDTRLLHLSGLSINQKLSTRHVVNRAAKTVTCAVLIILLFQYFQDIS